MIICKEFPQTCTAHFVQNAFSRRCSGTELNLANMRTVDYDSPTLKTNIHGHNYRWLLKIKSDVNPVTGMVLDFGEFKSIKTQLDAFDHAFVLWENNPPVFKEFFTTHQERLVIMKKPCTAENMAGYLFKIASDFISEYNKIHGTSVEVYEAIVYETDTGSAIATSCDEDDVLTFVHDNSY